MVDEINSMPIPAVAKKYARLKGMAGLRQKQRLWYKVGDVLINKGRNPGTFASLDAAGPVKHSMITGQAKSLVRRLLKK